MATKSWTSEYKPSLNSGVYGNYVYPEPINFHPKPFLEYFNDKNDHYFVTNKLHRTLEHIAFDIDAWFPLIEPITFETTFLSITPAVAQSMILFYRYRYCNTALSTLSMVDVTNLRQLHKSLNAAIASAIDQWYDNDDEKSSTESVTRGVFIRCSNRSPKDGYKGHTSDTTLDDDSSPSDEEVSEMDANARFIAFCRRQSKALLVENGDEAMSLLLSSERVFTDLLAILEAHRYPFKYLYRDQMINKVM